MLLTRLYLRNYRVYEDELDLALPPGLVGIYGANGAGKSTLLEAITFTLWGRARTVKEQIRTARVGRDCVTEVEFEHEGHLYLIRRTLTGLNSTMKAEARCDGLVMAEGSADTRRYVHSVLGMDDSAFKASVFAEQKQLAAFSSQAPAERRRLVLNLLGITPLDGARDAARRDARNAEQDLLRLRGLLPDLDRLRQDAADAAAAADADATLAAEAAAAAAAADLERASAERTWQRLDETRQAYDALVLEGRAGKRELDAALDRQARVGRELAELADAASTLAAVAPVAELHAARSERLVALRSVLAAQQRVDQLPLDPEPPTPDSAASVAAAERARRAADARAGVAGQLTAAQAALATARELAERSASLAGSSDCPLCGQSLGDAFVAVQAHRASEVAAAEAELERLRGELVRCAEAAEAAAAAAASAAAALEEARTAHDAWTRAAARRGEAEAALGDARGTLRRLDPVLAGRDDLDAAEGELAAEVEQSADAQRTAALLHGRLERRPHLEDESAKLDATIRETAGALQALRARLHALGYDPARLDEADRGRREAAERAGRLADDARRAALAAAASRERAAAASGRLGEGEEQHRRLADLDAEARHLGRLAALVSDFRDTVVATVGPRLAAQAAELFAELTDHEYDELAVDPDTYELQIRDAGAVYGLDRFSGSEVDLANLALRVAISEHVRFQSGGTVGLLVLDEVFGPLDEDRKGRMLQALEQLRGRFRQVLVVTHDGAIKEQLPNAVEVVKLPGRRATARLIG
jgi:exonuclease SbcC